MAAGITTITVDRLELSEILRDPREAARHWHWWRLYAGARPVWRDAQARASKMRRFTGKLQFGFSR